MASPATSSAILVVVLVASLAAGGANAATFTITNRCSFTVWPAATPVGGGRQLSPGDTWTINVPAGTSSGRVWGRTGCSFDGSGRGSCATGDCGGALSCMLLLFQLWPRYDPVLAVATAGGIKSCTLSGQPPLTLAEFTIGGSQDFYDLSVIDGYNLPMSFSCSSGVTVTCRDSRCPDAYLFPEDNTKTHACGGNSNYQVVFCP
ncbi:Os12g0629600 [Oryza sativa Japonica Group]|uniref:Os12g0629600 protein n=1 Tax=Oryza sativa subsp. japonica TaxID=39947 RepID=Q0ILR3_ORYSJ|nr:Os12g0629600 [Oryza sativa Japonica Group]|eukprot:NP_001067333.2 Os12g0629600 [Oryza sativa Japonica Group]